MSDIAAYIEEVATLVGTNPAWLDALINFETGGTYSPTIKNPRSSARGLIQITDAAAQDLGFRDSLDAVTKNPDVQSQMYNVVLPYLERYKPLETRQKLYMAVFYPAAMSEPPDTVFPAWVRQANPGVDTVGDYVRFVDARVKTGTLKIPKALPALIVAVGAGVALWATTRRAR